MAALARYYALKVEAAADNKELWKHPDTRLFVSNESYFIDGLGIVAGATALNFKEF